VGGDTYTAISGATGTENGITIKSWVVAGNPAGITAVTIPTTGSTSSNSIIDYLGGWAQEFQGGCTTVTGGDFLGFTADGSAHNLMLGATPSSGDTVVAYAVDTTWGGSQGDCQGNTITKGTGFTFMSDSTCYGKASEFDSSTTSTSVPITFAGTDDIAFAGFIIKQGSAGTGASGKYIACEQAEESPSASTTFTAPFPCPAGNTFVGVYSAPNVAVTSATSSNMGSPTFVATCQKENTSSSVFSQLIYANGATLGPTSTISYTLGGAQSGVQIEQLGLANMNVSSFVKCSAGTSQNHTTASNLTADTLTPTNSNDIEINGAAIDFHTLMGTATDANSHTPTFVSAVDTKGDDALNTCTAASAPPSPPSTLSEDNGYAIIQSPNTTQISFIYTGSQTTGSCTTKPTGTEQDASVSAEFK
jgi:hypothetical protein